MDGEAWAAFALPQLPFATPDDAAAFLGLAPGDKKDPSRVKAAYRRMCLKCHPDKNPGHTEQATRAFTAVTAALHTLTTANFDFHRWQQTFTIPPMQSLEDVLMLALSGADPDAVEAMLRKRGDYRPHRDFGVNLAVPWSAGAASEPAWDVPDGSAFNTSQRIGMRTEGPGAEPTPGAVVLKGDTTDSLLERLGEDRAVGASEDRPWESVGGVGFDKPAEGPEVPLALRPDLAPGDPGAADAADACNGAAVAAFGCKDYARARVLSKEAVRLAPDNPVFLANGAAAAAKLARHAEAARLAEAACVLDPSYARAWLRAGQANLALETEASVQKAIRAFDKALELEPGNEAAARGKKDALITWEAEFED